MGRHHPLSVTYLAYEFPLYIEEAFSTKGQNKIPAITRFLRTEPHELLRTAENRVPAVHTSLLYSLLLIARTPHAPAGRCPAGAVNYR